MAWFEKWRHVLRHDPKRAGKVIDAMRHLLRKGKGAEDIRKERAYFRNNRRRPPSAALLALADEPVPGRQVPQDFPSVVKFCNGPMKRSGQSWGRYGGQGVLTFRPLLKSR